MISKFLTINDTTPLINTSVSDALKDFKTGGEYNSLIKQIREASNKEERTTLKRKLPVYTFGGTFKQRKIDGLTQLSGYVLLEYDNVGNVEELKDQVKADKYTAAAGISVSGNGVWLLVKVRNISTPQDYKEVFNQLCRHYSNYGELDTKISDVSRVRYLSKDEALYINEYSAIYFFVQEATKEETIFTRKTPTESIINDLSWWSDFMTNGKYNNIVDTRHDWLRLGMAMKLSGLSFEDFDKISSKSKSYKGTEDCRKVWSETPKNVTTGTLLYFVLHKAGYKIPTRASNNNVEDETKYQRMERLITSDYEFIHNKVLNCIDWRVRNSNDTWVKLSDNKVKGITYTLNSKHGFNTSADKVWDFLAGYVDANELSYDPIVEGLADVEEFSEYDVFEKVAEVMGVPENSNAAIYLRKWFCASVININRDYSARGNELCLIFQGTQGNGKNEFVRHIKTVWESKYTVTHYGALDSKDFCEKLHKVAIIYMDELSALSNTKGIETVKSVLSQDIVAYRKSYGRELDDHKVYANFIASTNETHFLADQTGNRRFLVIEAAPRLIDYKLMPPATHIWGYAKYLVRTGQEHGYFKPDEMELVNKDNESHTMVRDHLLALEEIVDVENGIVIYAKAIYVRDYLNQLGGSKTNNITSNRLLKDLRSKFNIDQKVKYINGKTERVLEFPIDKEHHAAFIDFVKEKYNKEITHTITTPTTQLPF